MASEAQLFDDVDDYDDRDAVEAHIPYKTLSKGAVFSVVIVVVALPFVVLSAYAEELFWMAGPIALIGCLLGVVSVLRIRYNPIELTGMIPALLGSFIGLSTLVGGSALQAYIYMTEVPEGYERVSWYDLKPSRDHPELPFSYDAAQLHGKKIFIKGYVHPGVDGRGPVKQFLLVGDMGTCCFGGMPKLTDMIEVTIVADKSVQYNQMRRRFGGTFIVDPQQKPADGSGGGYYKLHVDYVK